MDDLPNPENVTLDAASAESLAVLCAEFEAAWKATEDGGEQPAVEVFLTRVAERDQTVLRRELERIEDRFRPAFSGSVDASAETMADPDLRGGQPSSFQQTIADGNAQTQMATIWQNGDPGATLDARPANRSPDEGGQTIDLSVVRPGGSDSEVKPGGNPALDSTMPGELAGLIATKASLGSAVPGYEIVGELGRGGMGVVYKARQKGLNRWVALKMVLAGAHAAPEQLARFGIEAEAIARLQHPNIVQVYDIGERDGLPYFSLEFIDGGSLDKKVFRKAQPPREAAHLTETLARAIHYAHEHGVIHRDLKPANILMTRDGIPKITDFGLAKRLEDDSSQTRTGALMGTPSYMAPEQAHGDTHAIGPLADLYSVGAMFYELLTGRPPFQGANPMETIIKVRRDEPLPPTRLEPKIPSDLETICLKCLQKDPQKRYASCQDLAEDLRRFLSDEPILARPVSSRERLVRWCARNPRVATLLGAVAALLLLIAVGSTAAAFRIADEKAEAVRQRKLADEQAKAARKAEGTAETAQKQAEHNLELADKQADLAVKTLQGVVTRVEERLREKPNTAPLRLELVKMAEDGLKQVLDSPRVAGEVSRTIGVAYQRMGDVYEQLGNTEDTVDRYKKSVTVFEALAPKEPANDWIPWNLAISYDKLAIMNHELFAQADAALDYSRKSLAMREGLVANVHMEKPAPALRLSALAFSYSKLAILALEVGDPARAREYAQKALDRLDKTTFGPSPKDAQDRRKFTSEAYYYRARANAHLGAAAEARADFGRCLDLRADMVRTDPTNGKAKEELALTHCARGDFEMEQGQHKAALADFEKGRNLCEALHQEDKNDPEVQWYLANANYRVGVARRILGDAAGAEAAFRACLKTREVLSQMDPKNFLRKVELMLAQARCGQYGAAGAQAKSIVEGAKRHPGILYSAACGYALCIPAVARDKSPGSLSPADQALKRQFAADALATLRLAIDQGFRDTVALKQGVDIEPLRADPRFGEVVKPVTVSSR